ncbi:MAG TPA: ABC transporter ATP-binding protein [Chloroflexota bacterium]|jgi:iron(III) transport system ATP-binding protein
MLNVQNLRLTYSTEQGTVEAVRGISFSVERGNFYTLLGPSGCGKTSTLRCIAGLENPSAGHIEIGPSVVYSSAKRTLVPPHKRDIGMVFQSYAIWPHMTVYDNVAFPLVHGQKKQAKNLIRERVMRALSLVQLDGLAQRPAPQLSGGQQQRVALARAIANEPAVLLLDEPLSNLDAKLREDMRHEIKALVKRLETTTLYVTHDQLEALSMSDTVALVKDGVIIQEGAPRDVYLQPADPFAANFLGRTNVLEGQVVDGGLVETRWGSLACPLPEWAIQGTQLSVGFRPESVSLLDTRPLAKHNVLEGTIASASFSGDAVEYQVDLGQRLVRVKGQPFSILDEGQRVFVSVPGERLYVLSA